MASLQKPDWVWYDGGIRPWEDATFHVSSEALVRGLNVFEGLKGYWQPDGRFGIVAVPRHHARLVRSARLLHIPFEETLEEFAAAHHELLARIVVPDRQAWVRATLYVEEGHWGRDTKSSLVLTAFTQPMGPPEATTVGVSAWRRSADSAMPYRVKTSSNYQVARLARIEGRPAGHGEMILLNAAGRVAEATGACVMAVRDGVIICPPASEGSLESITVDILITLAQDMGVEVQRRPLDHSELKIADEVGLCGTLAELTRVTAIDAYDIAEWSVLQRLQDRYLDAVTGQDPHPAADMHLAGG